MKIKELKVIESSDWDKLVSKTYLKPYCYQQQNECQNRGLFHFRVPRKETFDDEMNDSIPEEVNHETMGVKFEKWKARDPKTPLNGDDSGKEQWAIDLWWHRNFYPDFQTVANDLCKKGLLKAGSYAIDIYW
jgi:hypothetical protein